MKILNGQQAFAELSAGKKIEARFIHPDHGFQPLESFTATVFIQSEYEFRIAVTYMSIGEMQVPEPINEAPAKGTQCFLPSVLTEALSKSFKWKDSETDLILMKRGQVHLVQEHAETHALALIKISGGSLELPNQTESEGVQKIHSPQNEDQNSVDEAVSAIQKFTDAIDKCSSDYELQGVENNLKGNQHKLRQYQLDELTKRIAKKRQILNDVKKPVTVEVLKDFADQNKQCTDYVQKINACASQDELYKLDQEIIAHDKLNIDQQEQLVQLTKKRAEELMPATETNVDQSSENLSVTELHELQKEAEKLIRVKVEDVDSEYQNLLKDLLDRVANASTPAEVNAAVKYTKAWSEDQRKPLLGVIHNRLLELNPPLENTSLSVKIKSAKDLTELDVLEIDVSACDEFIQENLMELIHKRRIELDVFTLPLGGPL